ncbi:hypothetical protein EVAR_44523_1 [Eumeta japonica]|uniref:Uncharacterized protein n=1 Tax=Eumeta variegata TaxID=151549 RepID=A0A4C1YIK1_EUMVA|nr:hypothetical protein EVAR_44523_1 [Eumeta japonica]
MWKRIPSCSKLNNQQRVLLEQGKSEKCVIAFSVRNGSAWAAIGFERDVIYGWPPSRRPAKILGTAVVRVRDDTGARQTARVMIDSRSHDSFVIMRCARRLGLPMRRCDVFVTGLGQNTVQKIDRVAFCSNMPKDKNNPLFDISFIVLPKITSKLPFVHLPPAVRNHFAHINLADKHFDVPSAIDFILKVELFDQIYDGQRITPGPSLPCALSNKCLPRDSNLKTEFRQFIREYEDLGHMQPVGSAPTRDSAYVTIVLYGPIKKEPVELNFLNTASRTMLSIKNAVEQTINAQNCQENKEKSNESGEKSLKIFSLRGVVTLHHR